jgi:hypothetical protein
MNKYNASPKQEIQNTDKKVLKPKSTHIKKTEKVKATIPETHKKREVKPKRAKDLKSVPGEITFENNVLNS